jgi:DNA primase
MVYDGDTAGETATLRSLDILIDEGMQVKVAPLPKGIDPDVMVRKAGVKKLRSMVEEAVSFFDYKLGLLKNKHNIKDAYGKTEIAAQMLSTINKFDNAILKGEYLKKLAEEIRVPEENILKEMYKLKPSAASPAHGNLGLKKSLPINPAEKLLIRFMLEEKEMLERIMRELSPSDFLDERTSRIVSVIQELALKGKCIEPSILMNYFGEEEASQLLCETMFMPPLSEQGKEKAVSDCIARIKIQRLRLRREDLHLKIKNAQSSGDEKELSSLIHEFHNLIKKGDEA